MYNMHDDKESITHTEQKSTPLLKSKSGTNSSKSANSFPVTRSHLKEVCITNNVGKKILYVFCIIFNKVNDSLTNSS